MTRNDIRNAYNSTNPTQEQKKRMLDAILSAAPQDEPRYSEYTAAPTKTHWWAAVPAAVLLIGIIIAGLMVLTGTEWDHSMDAPSEQTVPSVSESEPVETMIEVTESTGEEIDFDILPYEYLLDIYAKAIKEDWNPEKCIEMDINYMVFYLESLDQIGYALIDFDGNGSEELIISDGDVIYDMYTLTDCGPEQLLSGTERNTYQLCEGNFIANRGSNSASNTVYNFYRWDGVELEMYEFIIFDASIDENAPWFGGFRTTHENAQPLTEAEAQAVIDSYKVVAIEIKPLETVNETGNEHQGDTREQADQRVLQAYADYVEWLVPWRIETFISPKQLYYSLTDYDGNGIVDLMLGYEDEFSNVWTFSHEMNQITLPGGDDVDWDALDKLWLALDLAPIEEFPLGERLEKEVSGQNNASYADLISDYLENPTASDNVHYALFDVNGDGVDDLLIGTEDSFGTVKTVKDGEIVTLLTNGTEFGYILCENGVVLYENEKNYFAFQLDAEGYREIDEFGYDAWEEKWYRTQNGNTEYISEETIQSILDSYGRVELKMKPMSEYPVV